MPLSLHTLPPSGSALRRPPAATRPPATRSATSAFPLPCPFPAAAPRGQMESLSAGLHSSLLRFRTSKLPPASHLLRVTKLLRLLHPNRAGPPVRIAMPPCRRRPAALPQEPWP